MLYHIPAILPPDLVHAMLLMGHGDTLVLGDANFPGHGLAKSSIYGTAVRCDGVGVEVLLEAVLSLMPLDASAAQPAFCMAATDGAEQTIHRVYAACFKRHGYGAERLAALPRFAFYEKAAGSFVIAMTGETARFGNLILQKGVVQPHAVQA